MHYSKRGFEKIPEKNVQRIVTFDETNNANIGATCYLLSSLRFFLSVPMFIIS